ncbi:MAG: class I SAM-dependent methyltransferase [Candidatus Dormibacteraceae bacterium]
MDRNRATHLNESVSFDRAADYYDRTRALPESLMARLIPLLMAELPRGGRCLEIGVGTGRIALPLARAGVSIVGIDISREMLRRLVTNADGSTPPIAIADATRLPFKDQSFESAIASHVLHLIPKWAVAVDELFRVLRPRGVLLASRRGRPSGSWKGMVRRHFIVEAGDAPWPPGIDSIEDLASHMHSRGAVLRTLPELWVDGSSSISVLIDNLQAGYWSGCWNVDAHTRTRAAGATRRWAKDEFGDLDQARPSADSSVWHAYVVP